MALKYSSVCLLVLGVVMGCRDSHSSKAVKDAGAPHLDSAAMKPVPLDSGSGTTDSSPAVPDSSATPPKCTGPFPGITTAHACMFGPEVTREGVPFNVELRVTGVSSAGETCFSNSKSPQDVYLPSQADAPRGRTVGWRLTDRSGGSWVVEFNSDTMPQDLLTVGTAITLEGRYQTRLDSTAEGHVALRDAASTVAVLSAEPPGQTPTHGFGAGSGDIECTLNSCEGSVLYGRFNTPTRSIVLGRGQTGDLDGFRFTNEFNHAAGSSGTCFDPPGSEFVFLAYRLFGESSGSEHDAGL